jgi:hypothetical protein
LLKKWNAMTDPAYETSSQSVAWTDEPKERARDLYAFVDSSQPIVPPACRHAFLGERWIAGQPCVVQQGFLSTALLVDVSFSPLFCDSMAQYRYENADEALLALRDWNGQVDPPGRWMKEVVTGRMGPGAFDDCCS